jgi:hypothetical protein
MSLIIKKQKYTFDYNLSPHAKNNNFYYNMGHVLSQYWYLVPKIYISNTILLFDRLIHVGHV